MVRQVIPGRPLIDISGNTSFTLGVEDVDDDEEDEDEDEDELELDDEAILDEIRDRVQSEGGRCWVEIAATLESVTFALQVVGTSSAGIVPQGCLVRMIAWGLDGEEHHTTTWIPGISLADLERLPEPKGGT